MRLKQGPRVTVSEPKKHKMHELMERHGLHYAKNLKDTMEAHNTKVASIAFRKQILDNQTKHNYQSEFEKVRGILAQSNQPYQTVQRLQAREAHLKALGAKAITMD
jgi:hypothetical protein